jgi:hypothetical protein
VVHLGVETELRQTTAEPADLAPTSGRT